MIERFLDGADDPATLAELRNRITRWLSADSGPDLARVMGLGCRSYARKARRDALLRQAAALLPGRPSERIRALLAAVRALEVRRLDRWRRSGVPASASEVDRLLFQAMQFGPIPGTERQLRTVLCPD